MQSSGILDARKNASSAVAAEAERALTDNPDETRATKAIADRLQTKGGKAVADVIEDDNESLMQVLRRGFKLDEFREAPKDKEEGEAGAGGAGAGGIGGLGLLATAGTMLAGLLTKVPGLSRAFGSLTARFPVLSRVLGTTVNLFKKLFWPLTALFGILDAFKGWSGPEAQRLFGADSTLARSGSSLAHVISGLTLGYVAPESVANGLNYVTGNDHTAVAAGEAPAAAPPPAVAGPPPAAGDATRRIGDVSARYESRGRPDTISTGEGDRGGKSYGEFQLASAKGVETLQAYLRQSQYGAQFEGLTPGSAEFDAKWREMSKDPGFVSDQHGFIERTHYEPALMRAQQLGYHVGDPRLQEAIWSGSVQHGRWQRVLDQTADNTPGFAGMDAEAQIRALYANRERYAIANTDESQHRGLRNRYGSELEQVLAIPQPTEVPVAAAPEPVDYAELARRARDAAAGATGGQTPIAGADLSLDNMLDIPSDDRLFMLSSGAGP
jgi:hypothetical protein